MMMMVMSRMMMVMIVVKLTRYVDGDHDDGCEVNYGDYGDDKHDINHFLCFKCHEIV